MRLVFFHGSPGAPEDFSFLIQNLNSRRQSKKFEARFVLRSGYATNLGPDQLITPEDIANDDILVGFSWGAAEALLAAAHRNHKVGGLILIAPFLPDDQKVGFAKRLLLRLPLVSHLLLALSQRRVLLDFTTKIAHPREASPPLKKAVEDSLTLAAMRSAVLEKHDRGLSHAIKSLTPDVPCCVVIGDNDIVAPPAVHLKNLSPHLASMQTLTIHDGGHSLLFTHPQAIAEFLDLFLSKTLDSEQPQTNQINRINQMKQISRGTP